MKIRNFITLRIMEAFLILGPCFLLAASGWAVRNAIVLHRGISALGTVTDVLPASDESDPFYRTTFSFNATDGRSYKVTPNLMERPAPYKIGDSIPVVYKAAAPYDASITSMKEMWGFPIGFGTAGAVVLMVGLRLWKKNRSAYARDLDVDKQTGYGRI